MVLYGYDASVFNSVQGSDNWLAWFNLNTVGIFRRPRFCHTWLLTSC